MEFSSFLLNLAAIQLGSGQLRSVGIDEMVQRKVDRFLGTA